EKRFVLRNHRVFLQAEVNHWISFFLLIFNNNELFLMNNTLIFFEL
ncbi:hypothetical protein KKC_14165, partial [Listeria fleischmannii subsp. coloradonensis]